MMGPMASDEMPKSIEQEKKERLARQAALKKRLQTLPQDNPIVKAALEQKEAVGSRKKKSEKWEIIENLQFTAYNEFFDNNMPFEKTVKSLGQALIELVK